MQLVKIYIYILYSLVYLSCKSEKYSGIERGIGYGNKVNGLYECGYFFDNDNILYKNSCTFDSSQSGYTVFYHPNGMIKSFEPEVRKQLHGNKIDYYSNGILNQITPYDNGQVNGIVKIYYTSGYIKSIFLVENNEVYYSKDFNDSLPSSFGVENIIPIVSIDHNEIVLNDSVEIHIRIPFNHDIGLIPNKYILRYDQKPSHLLIGKNPFANYSVSLNEEDVYIGVTSSIPSHDKFYCYITDIDGNILGPTIYTDLHFVDK